VARVYTPPVKVCKAHPEQAPTWQLKSDKIIHDQERELVEYHHAWLEMWGWPIFYTPYFSHPDPAVKRKSGFLMPTYSHGRDLGYVNNDSLLLGQR
jgi:LPS-assembly protein